MNLVLGLTSHLGVPFANQIDILIDAIGLYFMKHDGVDVLPAREHLTEASFDLGIHLATLLGAIDEVSERSSLARRSVSGRR